MTRMLNPKPYNLQIDGLNFWSGQGNYDVYSAAKDLLYSVVNYQCELCIFTSICSSSKSCTVSHLFMRLSFNFFFSIQARKPPVSPRHRHNKMVSTSINFIHHLDVVTPDCFRHPTANLLPTTNSRSGWPLFVGRKLLIQGCIES